MRVEEFGDAGGSTLPTVIKGQKERKFFFQIGEVMRGAGREIADLRDCRQMGLEIRAAQFVFRRSRSDESAGVPVSILDDIVIEQTSSSQWRLLFAARF